MSSLEIISWVGTILTVSQVALLAHLYYKTGWCVAIAAACVWLYWAYSLEHYAIVALHIILLAYSGFGLIHRMRFENESSRANF